MEVGHEGENEGISSGAVTSTGTVGSGTGTMVTRFGNSGENRLAIPAGGTMEPRTDLEVAVTFLSHNMSSQAVISRRLDRINSLEHKLERRKVRCYSADDNEVFCIRSTDTFDIVLVSQETRAELRSRHRRWAQERKKDRQAEGRERLRKQREKLEKIEEVKAIHLIALVMLDLYSLFYPCPVQENKKALTAAAKRRLQRDGSNLTWLLILNLSTFFIAAYMAEHSPNQTIFQFIGSAIHNMCRDKTDKMTYPWWLRSYLGEAPQLGVLGCYAEKAFQGVIAMAGCFLARWLLGEFG